MKTLFSVMVVVALAVASPLCASTVIFQENFDGTADTPVNGHNDWTGDGEILYSAATIDQGGSAYWPTGTNYPAITKGFSYTLAAGENAYTLTATLDARGAADAYSDLRISDGRGSTHTIGANLYDYGATSTLQLGSTNVEAHYSVTLPSTTLIDVKIALQDRRVDYSYRAHGDTAWTSVGGKGLDETFTLSSFNTIEVWGYAGHVAGGMDSILLTAGTVPEPNTCVLLITGLFGLLAYAWRRRR